MRLAKRTLSLLLALSMLLALTPAAFATAPTSMSIKNLAVASDFVATALEASITAGTAKDGVYNDVVIPIEVGVGKYTMGVEDYTLMAAQAIRALNSGSAASMNITYRDITLKSNKANGSAADTVNCGQVLDLARRVASYGVALGMLPTSFNRPADGADVYDGRVCIFSIAHIFAKTLAYYNVNGTLPETVTFAPSGYTTTATTDPVVPDTPVYDLEDWYAPILAVSDTLRETIETDKGVPEVITVGGYDLTPQQYLYAACQVVIGLNAGTTSGQVDMIEIEPAPDPKDSVSSGNIYKAEYVEIATTFYNHASNNYNMPNYVSTSLGNMRWEIGVYLMARILKYYYNNSALPNYSGIYGWAAMTAEGGDATFGNDFSAYSEFLVPTIYCQSNNATLMAVAITGMYYSAGADGGFANPSSTYEAMFNLMEYINDSTDYDLPTYLNTRWGALSTWNRRAGNCCDMAHLVIACARSLGVPGRYDHWNCTFSKPIGHVFAALYCPDAPNPNINNQNGWLWADPVNNSNYLGYQSHINNYAYSDTGNAVWSHVNGDTGYLGVY